MPITPGPSEAEAGLQPGEEATAEAPLPEAPPGGRRGLVVAAVVVAALLGAALIAVRPWQAVGKAGGPPEGGPVPVRGAAVTVGDLATFASYPGELVGEAIELAPKVSGRLQAVQVRVGDQVAAGEEVAVIDDTDLRRELEEARARLAVAEANRRRAEAALEQSSNELQRAESLSRDSLISAQDLDRVESQAMRSRAELQAAEAEIQQARARVQILERQVGETRLAAPFTGSVAARYLDPGALVQAGTAIVRLVQSEPLLVQFRVPERDLGRVTEGSPFTLTTQATGTRTFAGQVRRLSGEVSRQDRSVLVEGRVAGNPGILRPGMYAEARVQLEQVEGGLLVPGAAVTRRVSPAGGEEEGVFTAGGDGRAHWRPVKILAQAGGRVAVSGDLQPGDTVLTLGHEELADGSPVNLIRLDGETGTSP